MKEIREFIQRRFPYRSNWKDGNCYWFAYILCARFPQLDIYYDPIEGHFWAGDGKFLYDYDTIIPYSNIVVKLSVIRTIDPLWYDRLVRDCIN